MGKRELERELEYLGLIEKAREILSQLGDKAALSYLKSSYRLLSKVYHPDLNPENKEKAKIAQQRLNRVSDLISKMSDEEIVDLIRGAARSEKNKEKPTTLRGKKILVVEDEFGLQETFRDIFRMEGYEVRVAVDGVEGYKAFHQFYPDLVFTDVVMPQMDGLELVRKIRETHPETKVIYVSGFFGINRLKDRLTEDIEKYNYPTLSKPFKVSAMLDLVRSYLIGEYPTPF
ncbi:MAG: response regulator [Desulfobacteraceae bacterium]|nr:MAG: response regulator [Desulfobacteraceae bacterium]